jgi:hypothetical protein
LTVDKTGAVKVHVNSFQRLTLRLVDRHSVADLNWKLLSRELREVIRIYVQLNARDQIELPMEFTSKKSSLKETRVNPGKNYTRTVSEALRIIKITEQHN